MFVLEQNEEWDILTTDFTPSLDRKLYTWLLQGLKCDYSYNFVSKLHRDKGKAAFKMLDTSNVGTTQARTNKAMVAISSNRLTDEMDASQWIAKQHEIEDILVEQDILAYPSLKKPSLLAISAIDTMPFKFQTLMQSIRLRDNKPYPTLEDFHLCFLLNREHSGALRLIVKKHSIFPKILLLW